jgi:hypothetical protein
MKKNQGFPTISPRNTWHQLPSQMMFELKIYLLIFHKVALKKKTKNTDNLKFVAPLTQSKSFLLCI